MNVDYTITNNNLPLLSQLEPLMKQRLELVMKQIGEMLERGAVLAIQKQVAPDGTAWAALQAWYVEWKEQHGYSNQIYLMSSSYIQAITWRFEASDDDMQTIVGVMRDSGFASGGLSQASLFGGGGPALLEEVAKILEYGWEEFNVKIPPRPLWRPLIHANERSIQTRIGAGIYWATKKIQEQAGRL